MKRIKELSSDALIDDSSRATSKILVFNNNNKKKTRLDNNPNMELESYAKFATSHIMGRIWGFDLRLGSTTMGGQISDRLWHVDAAPTKSHVYIKLFLRIGRILHVDAPYDRRCICSIGQQQCLSTSFEFCRFFVREIIK